MRNNYIKYSILVFLFFILSVSIGFFFGKNESSKIIEETSEVISNPINQSQSGSNVKKIPKLSTNNIDELSQTEKLSLREYITSLTETELKTLFFSKKFYFSYDGKLFSNIDGLQSDLKDFYESGFYDAFIKCILPLYLGKEIGILDEQLRPRHTLVEFFKQSNIAGLKKIQNEEKDEELKKFSTFLLALEKKICDPHDANCAYNTPKTIRDLLLNTANSSGYELSRSSSSQKYFDLQIDLYVLCLYKKYYSQIIDVKPFLNQASIFMTLDNKTGEFNGNYDEIIDQYFTHMLEILKK